MVELTARFQFFGPTEERISIHIIFHESHISMLKPLFDQKLSFWLHGTLSEGLRFDNSEPILYHGRGGTRLSLYNNKLFKIQGLVHRGMANPLPPPSELKEIKVTWDAKKKAFLLPPINVKELKTRKVRIISKKAAAGTAPAAPGTQAVAPSASFSKSPLEKLRDSLRAVNALAGELGVELALDKGRVRAILTFE